MFVWGYAPIFYYYADLPAASRFVVMAQARLTSYISGNLESVRGHVPVEGVAVSRHWEWLLGDLESRHATYIVDTAPAAVFRWNRYPLQDYPRPNQYVQTHFEIIDVIDDVRIFRRKGCEAAQSGGSERQN